MLNEFLPFSSYQMWQVTIWRAFVHKADHSGDQRIHTGYVRYSDSCQHYTMLLLCSLWDCQPCRGSKINISTWLWSPGLFHVYLPLCLDSSFMVFFLKLLLTCKVTGPTMPLFSSPCLLPFNDLSHQATFLYYILKYNPIALWGVVWVIFTGFSFITLLQ